MTENENSPENLRKFLESDDPAMRMMGLSMAKASYIPKELYQNVFGLSLWDPEKENREAAKELVEKIGLENISEFPGWLEPFEGEVDEWARSTAVKTLGNIGDERAVELLIEALRVDNSRVREGAVKALGNIGDKRAVNPLIKALGDHDKKVCIDATIALGKIGDARAVEHLNDSLENENENLRRFAAEALGKIGDTRAVEPLIEVLSDKAWHVRLSAVKALGNIGDARAVEPLINIDDDSLRRYSEYQRCQYGWNSQRQNYTNKRITNRSPDHIIDLESEPSANQRKMLEPDGKHFAVEALKRIGEPAIPLLLDKLNSWGIRQRWPKGLQCKVLLIIDALGEIGDVRAVEPLIKVSGEFPTPVTEALGQIGDAKAVETLIELLEGRPADVAKALEKIAAPNNPRNNINPENLTPKAKAVLNKVQRGEFPYSNTIKKALEKLGHEVE